MSSTPEQTAVPTEPGVPKDGAQPQGKEGALRAQRYTQPKEKSAELLRIALSHGGGAFPALAARLDHAWQVFPALQESMPEAPLATSRRLYFDSLVYNPVLLRQQIALFGASQTLIGTDYPFVILDKAPVPHIRELELGPELESMLLRDNALRWLGLPASR